MNSTRDIRNFWKSWKDTILLVFCIVVLALVVRLFSLTYLPVFADEAIYVRWAQVMRVEPSLRFLPLSDGKQPLFMWVIIPFLKIFSNPLFAARFVSVLTGVGTVIGVFILSHLLFESKKLSLIASLAYAVSPLAVFFDRMALVDSMLTFFGIWVFVFAVIAVKKVRLDSAMLAGFALGGALLTKSPGLFFAILIPTTWVLSPWSGKVKERFSHLSILVFLFTFTYAIAIGMYNILRLGTNFHMISIRNRDYVYPLTHIFQNSLDPLSGHARGILSYFWLMGPTAITLLVILGVLIGLKLKRKETLLLLAWLVLPMVVFCEYSKTMTARYILFSIPYLFIISALPFGFNLSKKVKREGLLHPLSVLVLTFLIFVAHSLFIDLRLLTNLEGVSLPRSERSGYLEEWTTGTGIYEVSNLIREEYQKNPHQKIVVGTEGYFGTLPDGLQIYLNDLKEITVIGTGLDFKEIPKSLIESKQAGNKTYFVVNSSRLIADQERLDLKLLAAYPKAKKPDGSRETLYFFEVID